MPILYSLASEDVIWAGFHGRVFFPSTFCHSVCEMVPHYSPKGDNNNRFGEFFFSLRPVYGRVFFTQVFLLAGAPGREFLDVRIRNPMLYH